MSRSEGASAHRRTIWKPWRGHNHALLAGQVRTSTGAVHLFIPPPRVPPAAVSAVAPALVCEALLSELHCLAEWRADLPSLEELGARLHLGRGPNVALALDALAASGRIRLLEGTSSQFPGCRAVRLANGAVLRSAGCPKWWMV